MQVVILAGGYASRLKTLTENIPKALLKINKKPFINYQLKYLKNQGITDVVLCLNHLAEQITSHVGDGSKYGLIVNYSYDGIKPLGTGGALKNAFNFLDENFFVMYGDSFLPVDFKKIYREFVKKKANALMTIYENKNSFDQSNIIFNKKKIVLYDKFNHSETMKFIDYGLSILNKNVLKEVKQKKFDLSSIFTKLSKKDLLDNYIVRKRFYEIGSFSGIKDFNKYVKKNNL